MPAVAPSGAAPHHEQALIRSAQINGLIALPIMIGMLLAHNKTIMGSSMLPRRHAVIGWSGVAVMLAAVEMFATM